MWNFFADDLFPTHPTEADIKKKRRFMGYRLLAFWLHPDMKRKQRKPLPACLYNFVHCKYPPTDNEEDFADWRFSEFVAAE